MLREPTYVKSKRTKKKKNLEEKAKNFKFNEKH